MRAKGFIVKTGFSIEHFWMEELHLEAFGGVASLSDRGLALANDEFRNDQILPNLTEKTIRQLVVQLVTYKLYKL